MTGTTHDNRPLAGARVLDLIHGPLAMIGRQLAELGAEVIRVESRHGADDRRQGPCVNGVSLSFLTANLGKRLLALDLAEGDDASRFEQLLAQAQIVLHLLDDGVLDPPALHARYPHLVILSVSPFGRNTSLRHWQAADPVLHALSGGLSRSGLPGREPLLPPGDLNFTCAAAEAVYVVLLAYFHRLRNGKGDWLDFSLLDGAAHALDPGYGIAGSATNGEPLSQLPRGRIDVSFYYPIIPCKDGFVRICVLAPRQWRAMLAWLGEPPEFSDPAYDSLSQRFASMTLIPAIARLFAGGTREELEREGVARGIPIASVLSVDEAVGSDQVKARDVLTEVQLAKGILTRCPGGMLEIDGRRTHPPCPAPGSEQHPGFVQPEMQVLAVETAPGERPLGGLRVLDLGVIVVGAEQGRLLADQGADVIKLETSAFPDGNRQTLNNAAFSTAFAAGHRNKRGLGLNLRSDSGKALFCELIKTTDIVLSNFKPGTLAALELDEHTLRALNPRLIMLDSSAFGATGPWSRRLGYGPLVRASSGLSAQWRYPDEPASFSDASTVYPDHVAARIGVIGVLALLIRRLRTGLGGTASVAQMEVILHHLSTEIATRCVSAHADVAHPVRDAPWGIYPCAGEDEWCVVSVRNDRDWRSLCQIIGRSDLADDPALATASGRAGQRVRVEDALCRWLSALSPMDAMHRLQTAGVPAGAMLRVSELPAFTYYRERGFFRGAQHPLITEPFIQENAPVHSQYLPDPPYAPAPVIGQHTEQILRERLGLCADHIQHLAAEGAIELASTPIEESAS